MALLRSRHFDLEEGCEKFAQAFFSVDLRSNKFMFTDKIQDQAFCQIHFKHSNVNLKIYFQRRI